ncbi:MULTISPECIES: amidohydrolase family protein [Klebsiella pneumoniae complex]|uniref:amidohydrolase family protein n=1 Tax=Klebsiella pneumoniae complex TaxID=3390273 RepID=UPI001D196BB9|nr:MULTISPECIES: amidohydrolase family protein [Klebsiella]
MRENLYVTASGMFLPHFLDRAVAIVGSERILFSTDYPFQYRAGNDARQFLEKCNLNENDKAAFAHSNWMRLIRDRNAD